ncbi:hypothetical protein BS17DRAFT_806827 [Gyrodon lividus]|nr:hypothetical protein BS17DRAFT_806827 [Gyrodon lividus]
MSVGYDLEWGLAGSPRWACCPVIGSEDSVMHESATWQRLSTESDLETLELSCWGVTHDNVGTQSFDLRANTPNVCTSEYSMAVIDHSILQLLSVRYYIPGRPRTGFFLVTIQDSPAFELGDLVAKPQCMAHDLSENELFWSKRYNFFLSKGYTLRVRYSPNWVPSWHGRRGTDALPRLHEDHVKIGNPDTLDATSQDGTFVFIKKIYKQIALYLSSERLRKDPANHCTPIIDNFEDDEDQNIHYIIMPLLRPFNYLVFESVAEVLDFMKQVLQGLKFMHDNRVTHGDCVAANIMMDAKYLCPYGWHPIATEETRNLVGKLYYKNRSDVEVVYYIDFGLSTLHPQEQTRFVTGGTGRDREVPEFQFEIPHDPFKADIFILGHMFQTEFLTKYRRLDNLEPLTRLMTAQSPDERPTAEDALKSFERIRNIFPASSRGQQRLRGIDESDVECCQRCCVRYKTLNQPYLVMSGIPSIRSTSRSHSH